MNSRLLFLLICFAAYQLACTSSATPREELTTKPSVDEQQLALAESEKTNEAKPSEMTALKAKRLASTHLALRQTSWGQPTSITEDETHFYVNYETPKRELRILGERTLLVEKGTEVVKVRKRR